MAWVDNYRPCLNDLGIILGLAFQHWCLSNVSRPPSDMKQALKMYYRLIYSIVQRPQRNPERMCARTNVTIVESGESCKHDVSRINLEIPLQLFNILPSCHLKTETVELGYHSSPFLKGLKMLWWCHVSTDFSAMCLHAQKTTQWCAGNSINILLIGMSTCQKPAKNSMETAHQDQWWWW